MIAAAATLRPRITPGVRRARSDATTAVRIAHQAPAPRNPPATTPPAPAAPPVPAPMLANSAANDRMVAGLVRVSATIDPQAASGRSLREGSTGATGSEAPARSVVRRERAAI